MGRKLRRHLEQAGLIVNKEFAIDDQELAFRGPALPEVVQAWANRFDRMLLLQEFCGVNWPEVRQEFLACLVRDDHHTTAKVVCCMATNTTARAGCYASEL